MMMRSITFLATTFLFAAGCTISFGTDGDGELSPFPTDAGYPWDVADGGYEDAGPPADDAHPPEDGGGWPDAGWVPDPDAGCCGVPDGGWWISDASVPSDAYSPDATAYPDAGWPPDDDGGIPPHDDAGCDDI